MNWTPYYAGTGVVPEEPPTLPPPPPWRAQAARNGAGADGEPTPSAASTYRPAPGLVDAVNAALHLRRPLLLTGPAGSGKSTVVEQIAAELGLGNVLRWHITSRSTLADALYRYDALGRIHAYNVRAVDRPAASVSGRAARRAARATLAARAARAVRDDIGDFVQLGPLGTALLPGDRPRALLIDEIDKSDLDLPGDLLDVLERGRFEIPELARHNRSRVTVRTAEPGERQEIHNGLVECEEFPVIVLTSNGERDFPAPFLRRCVRFDMPALTVPALTGIVEAHLEKVEEGTTRTLVNAFVERLNRGESLAIDQLLSAVHLLRGDGVSDEDQRTRLQELLLQGLGRA
ncbi:ATPase [Streptomyces sp. CB03234]|uniref:AAA family ATPase n=1 Tax=Streptomyces sp. (strain CB03234) TaxID=1703937 RepID=UPI000939E597|nr:AAA family ATPase [Streptomyces sp. CB03234]OKJ94573.1 ATPase [Streptomyces sp. CB03234]